MCSLEAETTRVYTIMGKKRLDEEDIIEKQETKPDLNHKHFSSNYFVFSSSFMARDNNLVLCVCVCVLLLLTVYNSLRRRYMAKNLLVSFHSHLMLA